MTKIIEGLIKFYIVYMLFGVMAVIILYASADLKCLIQTGESFFQDMIHSPDSIGDDRVANAVQRFFLIAFESVPGDTFFDAVFGISFSNNVGADITSHIIDVFQSGETISEFAAKLNGYDLFWRDMAVATCASMVLYAVAHLKTQLVGNGIAVWLGFALASVFWILAGYTFAETLTYSLEVIVGFGELTALYIIITVTAILLEASIHAYGGKCSVVRLVVLLFSKIIFNLIRTAFVLYICKVITSFFGVGSTATLINIPINMLGVMTAAGIVVCISLVEAQITEWSEKIIA